MATAAEPLSAVTAGEMMSRGVLTIPHNLAMREAARRLAAAGVHGAPVVDEHQRCVGMLAVKDIARWAANLSVPSTIASVNSGTLVLGTICDSPATAAGLTAGSVITSIDDQTVGSPQSLANIMAKLRPGDTVPVTWVTPDNQNKSGNLALIAGPPL